MKTQQQDNPVMRQSYTETVKKQHSENVFNAFKTYKQQEEQLMNMANRIKKLQLNQVRNNKKTQNHQRLLSQLQKIRDQRQQKNKKFSLHKEMVQSQIITQQQKNNMQRSVNKQSIQNVFQEIKNKRLSSYDWMKQKKQENEFKVTKIKQLDLQEKKRVRDMIKGEQKSMKQSRMTKLKLKKQTVQKGNEREIGDLQQRGKVQQQQIMKLARLQQEIMLRRSESQARTLQVKQKYENFMNNQKSSLTQLTKKENIEGIYVHPLVKRIQKRIDRYNLNHHR